MEIIRSKAVDNGDEIEDLGRVAGFLQEFKPAPGEFIRVDAICKPPGRAFIVQNRAENTIRLLAARLGRMQPLRADNRRARAGSLPPQFGYT